MARRLLLPDGSVLVGGNFRHVQNVLSPGITPLDLPAGRISAGFDAWVDGDVRTLAVRGDAAYLGGWFTYADDEPRMGLARIDARTGALDMSFDAMLDAPEIGGAKVEDIALESAGFGAVARPGIAAIDPATGRALSWNPTRSRGEGLRAFVVCPYGLLVGSDTDRLGKKYHGRIGLFPSAA